MSFSEKVKNEILSSLSINKNECCKNAERFGEYLTQTTRKSNLSDEFKEFFDISKLSECCIKSILKGAFLSSGCIVDPKLDYHFELIIKNKACADYIYDLLSVLDFSPKLLKRKNTNNYIVYLKESDQIVTFLGIVQANKSVLEFEEIRVEKDVKNTINRNINCETANLSRTISNSVKVLNAIDKLRKSGKFDNLNDKLKYVAKLREEYQDKSLSYIAKKTSGDNKLSKSGLKHRLDKLVELANK